MPSASTTSDEDSSISAESSLLVRARPVSVARWYSRIMDGAAGGEGGSGATRQELCLGKQAFPAAGPPFCRAGGSGSDRSGAEPSRSGGLGGAGPALQPLADGHHQHRANQAGDELGLGQMRLEPGGTRRVGDEHLAGQESQE